MLIAVDCYFPLQKFVSCCFLQADLKGGRACRAKSTEDASTLPWLSAVKSESLSP